jgi:hypothetical protein
MEKFLEQKRCCIQSGRINYESARKVYKFSHLEAEKIMSSGQLKRKNSGTSSF